MSEEREAYKTKTPMSQSDLEQWVRAFAWMEQVAVKFSEPAVSLRLSNSSQ